MNRNRTDNERTTRIVTLDFNGGSHVYRNPELGMNIPVRIAPSGISADRARMLTEMLNGDCADSHVRFEVGAASSETISAVRIGRTADFDRYGAFLGLAEGIGEGDAYVLLDDSASDAELLSVIRHEAGHLLGTLDHGGAGLARYGWEGEIYDYFGASRGYKDPEYKVYLRRVTTTTYIYQYVAAPAEAENIYLNSGENGRTVKYWYSSQNRQYETSTDYVTETSTEECCNTASGSRAKVIYICGGKATHCTAEEMYVYGNYEHDSYKKTNAGEINETNITKYFNYTYYQGVATGCDITGRPDGLLDSLTKGLLSVDGNAVARQCSAYSISVRGKLEDSYLYNFYGTELETIDEYKLFNGLVENCNVIGGTLSVEFGGIANDIIVRDGGRAVIGADEDIAMWRKWAEEEALAMEEDEEPYYISKIKQKKYDLDMYGSAKANNLIVEGGNAFVNYGGELHNATIDGRLYATEGATLAGVITCKSVDLSNMTPGTNITIKLDLNDYKVANYVEEIYDDNGKRIAVIQYFANYTTRTYQYRDGAVISVTDGTFDNKDGRFNMTNWKYTFEVDIGKTDEKALPYIVVDFGGTEKDFEGGTLRFEYPSPGGGQTNPLPFQMMANKAKWEEVRGDFGWYDENGEFQSSDDYYFGSIQYDASLFGEAADVLWLENGWDDETEYTVALPSDIMKGATEVLSVTEKETGDEVQTVTTELKGDKLVFKGGAESGNYSVKAEEKDGRDHECDLDLWVIPEEIPVIGKAGTKRLAEILKKMQTDGVYEFSVGLPHNIHTDLYGMPFDLSDTAITITADFPQKSFSAKIQGKIEWKLNKDTAGTGKQLKLVVDLSGDNYISITNTKGKYDWDLVGEFKIPDFKLGKFEFSNMAMKVDVGKSSYSASAYVKLPWIKYAFGGSIGFVEGYWDSMAIGVDSLNVPLGTSGLFLQKIEGGISGIATELNLTFQGTLGLTAGPTFKVEYVDWLGIDSGEYSLCEITVLGTLTTNGNLSGEAEASILGGFITGGGGAGIKDGEFYSKGKYTLLNGCITVDGELRAGLSTGIKITGKGKMTVPAEKIFGPLAGMTLTVNAEASINVQNPDASYVKAWSDFAVMGYQVAMGFKYSFNKGLELTGCDDEKKDGDGSPKRSLYALNPVLFDLSPEYSLRGAAEPSASKTFTVTGSGLTLFQVNLSVSDATMSLAFGGVEYTQADIAAGLYENMRIVAELSGLASELSDANCITVAVNDAALGEWTINAYGDAEATFNAYSLLSTAPAPVLIAVEVGEGARSATLRYTADFSDLTDATISIFRADAGTTDFTSGSKIAEIAAADATGVYEYVMPDEVEGGDYLFYLAVNSDGRAPVYSAVSDVYTFRILDTEAPDQIQAVNSEWKSSGTVLTWEAPWDDKGVAGYKISYRMLIEKSEDEETGSEELDGEAPEGGSEEVIEEEIVWTEADVKTNAFTFDSVPNGTYIVRVAAYDAAGNLGAWSEEQSSLVLTVANAKYKNVVLTEDLELVGHESATGITASDFAIKAETNTLISGSVLGDAETGGIVENSTVNGVVTMLADSRGFNLTVNGTLNTGGSIDGATVNDGGTLIVGSQGSANDITVNAGGSLGLRIGSEYSGLTLAYGASLVFINSGSGNSSGKYLLTDDIRTAGTLSSLLYLDANGHKIRFEQYNQSAEYETSELYGTIDKVSFISDLDKLIGDALEMEIDSTVYGRFKIADKAQYFSGTITVIDHADRSSTGIGFDQYKLVGHAVCKLVKVENALYLETSRAEIDVPAITVEYADSNAYDYIDLTATPADNTERAKRYTFRYSLNADMSDAVTVETDRYGYARISKNDFADNATYYIQANVENIYGVTSAWSDAASFTVVPKVLPDAPPPVIVTDATNPSSSEIYLRVDVNTNDSRIKGFRFRYADNPEMENAVIVTNNASYQNYLFLEKSEISDGIDYYVQASMKYNGEWSYWSDTVVFNTQGWDYDGIIIGPEPDGTFNEFSLYGKRAKNVTVINGGYFYGGGQVDNLIVEAGGFFRNDFGNVTNVVVNGGTYYLDAGTASGITLNSGKLYLMNGALNGTIIGVNGLMYLDRTDYFPTISGTILIQGQFSIYSTHPVFSTDAEFIFDVGAHEVTKDKSFVDHISVLGGESKFTAKLDDTPEIGDYMISNLNEVPENGLPISLVANDGAKIGDLTVGGDAILHNGLYYSLIGQIGNVYLHISDNQNPVFFGVFKFYKDGTIYDSGDSCDDFTVSADSDCDYLLAENGAYLQRITVGQGGSVDLSGVVNGATVGAGGVLTMKEGSKALMHDVNIQKGGTVIIEGGSVSRDAHFNIAGTLTVNGILNRTESNPDQGSSRSHIFDFKLDQLDAPAENVMLSDFTGLQCDPGFIISVSAQQALGKYKLIGNAAGFRSYIVLHVEGHDYSEYLYLNQECTVGNTYYILSRENDVLSLRITDTQPAHVPYAYADITEVTTKSVTVTADFDETAKKKQYSLDGITWQEYTKALKFTQNGIVYFRALDAKGNSSEVISYEVTNIEKSMPEPGPGPDDPGVPDSGENNNPLDETGKPNDNVEDNPLEQGGSTDIIMDTAGSVEQDDGSGAYDYNNYVGGDDKVDNAKITLEKAAKLSFTVKADSKVKLTFYELVESTKNPGTYTKKALKTVTVSGKNGGEKTTASVLVKGGSDKLYYVAVENKNSQSKGAYYNVSLTTEGKNACEFFADGDNGENNGPLLVKVGKVKLPNTAQMANFLPIAITASGKQNVVLDNEKPAAADANPIEGGWKNYVGFGDDNDYVKLNITQPAKLNFTINSTGSVKLVVYKVTKSGSKWSQKAVKTLTVSLKKTEKDSFATRSTGGILLSRLVDNVEDGAGYYVSVQSTNAKSGGQAWYNVSVESTVFASDTGENNTLFTDKKSMFFNEELKSTPIAADGKDVVLTMESGELAVKSEGADAFGSFVGYGDETDYAQVEFKDAGVCTFTFDTYGTAKGTAKFTLYKLTKKANGSWTKKSMCSITVKNDGSSGYGSASLSKTVNITDVSGEKVKYYVLVQASNSTSKKGEMYYNVTASLPLAPSEAALTMPETDNFDALADNSLNLTDSLSFGGYATDALADVSASALADLDDKTGWMNIASLA